MKIAKRLLAKVEEKKFSNKQEFIDFIKNQTNVELIDDKSSNLNSKRNVLYTQIKGQATYSVLPLLKKLGIRYESHLDDYYWIWVK
jgi:hypothetical protein